jgi:hypothetical protein
MRESALFAAMFGLGAGAVLVGVTVSRLVVGQAPERAAEEPPVITFAPPPATTEAPPRIAEPPPAGAKTPPPAAVETTPPAAVETTPPAAVETTPPAAAETPPPAAAKAPPAAVVEPPRAAVVASTPEPPAVVAPRAEPAAPPTVQRGHRLVVRRHRPPPMPEQTPVATAKVPPHETERPPPGAHPARVAIVRGGAARPALGARASGPHIIHVDPQGGVR